ncbi:MAG: sel1 repeat family protein [Sorangiineae bacterium PRO1]|nr:sel1 repeat family protein [Sorangiineae bacterium PRO1]
MSRTIAGLITLAIGVSAGCGPGKVGEAVRPEAPKVQHSLCDSVADFGQPLIVDLKAHERAVYEAVMKDGVAVVSYDCNQLRIIKDCKIDGDYGFVGVSPKEEVVRLEGADEIQVNLPTFGAKIAAEVQRDASLDLGLILIGMRRTTVNAADKQRLKGSDCEKATHFVRGAFVGAFALKQGSSGSTRAAVEIMGAGASGTSKSSKRTENRDGDAKACKSFNPTAQSPDPNCAALLRLELTALEVASKDDAGSVDVCPKDLVLVNGKCAPPTSGGTFQCREGQLPECLAQCEKGHAGSCAAASFMYFGNHGVTADPERAASLAEKACAGGSARGCGNLGHAYDRGEALPKDMNKARELYTKSCEAGWPRGCSNLGVLTENDGDATAANVLFDRACSGGEARACHFLALNLDKGKGTAPDPTRAKALFARACNGKWEDACGLLSSQLLAGNEEERAKGVKGLEESCAKGSPNACRFLGSLRLSGTKLPRDPAKAAQDFERACEGKELKSCVDAATLFLAGRDGVARNVEKAAKLAKKGCDGGQIAGCRLVALGQLQGLGAGRDDAAALKLLEKSCADGDGESCAGAGLLYRHGFGTSANPSFATGLFDKACQARYGYGCALLAAARYDGSGVPKDFDAARAALGRACSSGYGPACGLSYTAPRIYDVTPKEDPFGGKNTAAGAASPSSVFGQKSTAGGGKKPADPFGDKSTSARTESALAPGADALLLGSLGTSPELEKRRSSLRDKFKAKLGTFKACPKDATVPGRMHRVGFAVGPDGKTQVTHGARSPYPKFDACLDKAVSSIKIAAGEHTIRGYAMLRLQDKKDAYVALSIQPDPSELVLPPAVRRLSGCGCGGDSTQLVCAIECRSGGGTVGGGSGGYGGPGPDYDEDKNTAPSAPSPEFGEKSTKPSAKHKDPFGGKQTMPPPPKKKQ